MDNQAIVILLSEGVDQFWRSRRFGMGVSITCLHMLAVTVGNSREFETMCLASQRKDILLEVH